METQIRWRKALVISLLFHSIVLIGVGWMTARLFTATEPPEQYLELELATEAEDPRATAGGNPAPEPAAVQDNRPVIAAEAKPTPAPVRQAPAVVEETAAAVPATDAGRSEESSEPGGNASTAGSEGGGAENGAESGAAGSGNGGTGSTGKSGQGGVIPPSILSRVEPAYPEPDRQAGREGTVVLKIQILANGRPGSITVHNSSGFALLDEAAVAAVRQWQFIPARERETGQAITCYTTMPVVFRLKV
ncbi:MAG TPA: TonB family protein [Methylomusa anaerophila]|uniref:Transport protein TonB n=1 Tax=Methylomusa anaerophila TaxID=1930071 RepID=A0A348AM69_9FIRM|nr:energy transducer TonB [Methylomusa anaerophila]BBB92167.1 transport protein TonB [Methylomusa anaerophila]HML87819.1 TonB family protein [Methylomusa anaerophila]